MRYAVDPDQLRKLATGLDDVASALSALGLARPGHDPVEAPGPLGSPAVTQALREVSDNWSQARRRLVSDVAHLARATQAAGTTYALVDDGEVRDGEVRDARPAGARR